MSTNDASGPEGYVFAVGDKPYCCWEHDHVDRSLAYLGEVDPDYFATVAKILAEHLGTDIELPASMALRAAYQQGIEALVSLLGAMAQAPISPQTWIAKCSNAELAEVARRLGYGGALLTQEGLQQVTFEDLAERTHQYAWRDETDEPRTAARFGKLWRRLAADLLDDTARAEYNAIKHGNRVSAGGFNLSIGLESEFGVPAPPEAMRSLGGSRFGSTFYRIDAIGASARHVRARRISINWSADAMVQRLHLISMSISNVVSALRCELGVDPTTVRFHRPTPASAFDDVFQPSPGIRENNLDLIVRIEPEDELSPAELTKILEQRGS